MTTAQLLMMLITPASALVLAGFAILLQKMSKPPRERGVAAESAKTKLAAQDERAATIEDNLKRLRREIEGLKADEFLIYSTRMNMKGHTYRISALRRGLKSAKAPDDTTKVFHGVLGSAHR